VGDMSFAIKYFLFFFALLLGQVKHSFGESEKTEALLKLIEKDSKAKQVFNLNYVAWKFAIGGQVDSAMPYSERSFALLNANLLKDSDPDLVLLLRSRVYNTAGVIAYQRSDFAKGLDYYLKGLQLNEKLGDKDGISDTYNNIGIVYHAQGLIEQELKYYFKALKIDEALGNKGKMATVLGNIGVVYTSMHKHSLALDCFFRAGNIQKALGDSSSLAMQFANIGSAYSEMASLAAKEGSNKSSSKKLCDSLNEKTMVYFLKALKIKEELSEKDAVAVLYANIGAIHKEQGKYPLAKEYLLKALDLSTEIGDLYGVMEVNQNLSSLFSATGDFQKSLEHYKKYTVAKDSLFNEEKNREFTRHEMNFEFDKKERAVKAEQDKKDALALEEKQKRELMLYSISAGLLLVVLLALFVYKSYRQKQKANVIITGQKEEVERKNAIIEEKHKEITDSISYAKRIQLAILAKEEEIKKHFAESFLLYKPKDIVAGDFYFFEVSQTHVFYAAADCTGHGVPGALVSVVCSNALTRCVNEFGLTDPGKILDKTRELVLETFKRSGQEIKDGMDISLLVKNVKNNTYQWSGANNPLWYLQQRQIKQITANKQPVGLSEVLKPFTSHDLCLNKGDIVFLFTDGFADQFGGPKGKKFKYKPLQELLLANSSDLSVTHEVLNRVFSEWKGSLEQVDDVCVIGVRV